MKIYLILLFSFVSQLITAQAYQFSKLEQIPNFESNTFDENFSHKKLMKFSKDKDLVIAFSEPGFSNGYENHYLILSLKKEKWAIWSYKGSIRYGEKKWWGTKWKQDSIKNGKVKFVKIIQRENAWDIVNTLKTFDVWNITQDSLISNSSRNIIPDSPTYTFDFITQKNIKQLRLYNGGYKLTNEKIRNAIGVFRNWWDLIQQKKNEKK